MQCICTLHSLECTLQTNCRAHIIVSVWYYRVCMVFPIQMNHLDITSAAKRGVGYMGILSVLVFILEDWNWPCFEYNAFMLPYDWQKMNKGNADVTLFEWGSHSADIWWLAQCCLIATIDFAPLCRYLVTWSMPFNCNNGLFCNVLIFNTSCNWICIQIREIC